MFCLDSHLVLNFRFYKLTLSFDNSKILQESTFETGHLKNVVYDIFTVITVRLLYIGVRLPELQENSVNGQISHRIKAILCLYLCEREVSV